MPLYRMTRVSTRGLVVSRMYNADTLSVESKGSHWSVQDGLTPLYLAVQNGHLEIVRLLLDAKAGTDAKNEVRLFDGMEDRFRSAFIRPERTSSGVQNVVM